MAVGCPFCKVMVSDSVMQVGGENAPPVLDVAEVMLAAVQKGQGVSTAIAVSEGSEAG